MGYFHCPLTKLEEAFLAEKSMYPFSDYIHSSPPWITLLGCSSDFGQAFLSGFKRCFATSNTANIFKICMLSRVIIIVQVYHSLKFSFLSISK